MKHNTITTLGELKPFLVLWITQSFSALGSSMTSFALIIWLYEKSGSALSTALLSVCSYAPYILLSIFAGALSDRWNKKTTMLVCDTLAAICSGLLLFLLKTESLQIWHLYALNIVTGTMNTVQQPASEVAASLLAPRKHYQRVSGLKSFSNALVTVLTPMFATALLAFKGMDTVVLFDLMTFFTAFLTLIFCIKIPKQAIDDTTEKDSITVSAKKGIAYLLKNRGILDLILFLAAINLTASIYNSALPAMILSRNGGSRTSLGLVTMVTGLATLAGSILASLAPKPKSRVKTIWLSLLFSMSSENFFLAFGKTVPFWCFGAIMGWVAIPLMSTNLDAIMRLHIPVEMQGRVYATRNTLQFFTIPVGYLLGGFLVDRVFEPFAKTQLANHFFLLAFGSGKGSGAAFLFAILGFLGIATCLVFGKDPHIWDLEKETIAE
ncbi:MFS transporter [uncultured Sphaerochaeta sp.]|uniref:MFS transporter n=1 Tax=uncultured Sphaerochaeta sp. TaxID=886478 RepID=UPI002A0A7FA6|nr:MFS transporter [uncultured Sphaerochaeta sp.]